MRLTERWLAVPVVLGLLSCGRPARIAERLPREAVVRSNMERGDYAGSRACAQCHRDEFDRFMHSPMHNMTRLPEGADIRAPFAGNAFRFKKDRVVLEQRGGRRWMRIESPEFGNRLFRVTKVIGGHHREDFAGVEAGAADTLTERILPVSYMLRNGTFRYKGYSVMEPERPGLKPGAVWNKTCLFCHNTLPYMSTILQALAGPDAPPYQGNVVDRTLPPDKRRAFVVTDSEGLRRALRSEIDYLRESSSPVTPPERGGPPETDEGNLHETAREALNVTWERFNETHLLEVGIGCESCHGGSREHALDPRVKTSMEPRSPYLHLAKPAADSGSAHAQEITRACARCHQVLFTGYPWTWEGGHRKDSDAGGAHINSGEARDLLLGNCQVTCTACHDPHAADDRARMRKLERREGGNPNAANAVCLQCHGRFASPEALRAHCHHDPQGAGGLCLNCHMPRKNMSLDTRLTRYHRVGSPNERAKVEGDRPLECALCHLDKPVGDLVETMELWWGGRYDRAKLAGLYGDLDLNAVEATLQRGKPHEQATALYLAGSGPMTAAEKRRLIPLVVRQLANPYPLVRYYADNALAEMLGAASPLDLHQENDSIAHATVAWLKSAGYALADSAAQAAPAPGTTAPVGSGRRPGIVNPVDP